MLGVLRLRKFPWKMIVWYTLRCDVIVSSSVFPERVRKKSGERVRVNTGGEQALNIISSCVSKRI